MTEEWKWDRQRAHGRMNATGGEHCPHCTDAGIVALDQRVPSTNADGSVSDYEVVTPCPVCERGLMHASGWDAECSPGDPFWRKPGWVVTRFSWNGGLTGAHYPCAGTGGCGSMRTRQHCAGCEANRTKTTAAVDLGGVA